MKRFLIAAAAVLLVGATVNTASADWCPRTGYGYGYNRGFNYNYAPRVSYYGNRYRSPYNYGRAGYYGRPNYYSPYRGGYYGRGVGYYGNGFSLRIGF